MPDTAASSNEWDLCALYSGVEDPCWESDLQQADSLADHFRKAFYGQIASKELSPQTLTRALGRLKTAYETALKPYLYAHLLFSADSTPPRHKAMLDRARQTWGQVAEQTLFFELEVLQVPESHYQNLIESPDVAPYRHHLNRIRQRAPYSLSEEVEQTIVRKDLSGKEGFVQLFEELTSSFRFRFTLPADDEAQDVTGEELLALLHHSDAGVREKAFSTFLKKHEEHALVLSTCFNNLLLDHGKEAQQRGYPDLMTPTHLSSETEPRMVERMMEVTEANYSLAQEYFRLKRRLLNLETLKNTDIYAPVGACNRTFAFEEAKEIILDAFAAFSAPMAEIAAGFFAERRIDAFPRDGKTGGAFCMGMMPGYAPYVLTNFTGNLRDVSTLAHELGHGVHFSLSQKQNFFHYDAPLPMTETASVFGEMLLTRRLLEKESDRELKIALLCAKLEDIIATTFRQNALTRFELAAHKKRGEGLLSPEEYCTLWWEENRKLFGDAVEMIEPYRWGWSYISHFVHSRFYCYSYVFGELLVLALYQKYLEEGDAFVPKYLELLSQGGSKPPVEMLAPLGIDLNGSDFWQKGYDFVGNLLEELKDLIEEK